MASRAYSTLSFAEYIKVFNHNSEGGVYFESRSDALSKNQDNRDANLFSILDQLDNYKGVDGNFQFKLCYPEFDKCNEWIQSSNPAKDNLIKGFKPISLTFKKNGDYAPWIGLGKTRLDSYSEVLIDDAPSSKKWHSAIGACADWPYKPRFPGPNGRTSPWASRGVTIVELYVWN